MKKKLSIALMSLVLVACLVATICLAGCVKANNAVEKADAAWAKQVSKDGGTATSVINIKGLKLSIGENGDEFISLDGKVTITRKIQGVSSKINVTVSDLAINHGGSTVDLAFSMIPTILGMIKIKVDGQEVSAINSINLDNVGDIKLSIDVEYNKDYTFTKGADEGKKGVALILRSIKLLNANDFIDLYYDVDLDNHEILTAAPEEINLKVLDTIDEYKSMIADVLGAELDIKGMIDNIFFGQTLINMEGEGAEYKDKTYSLKDTSFEKTLSFILDPAKNNLVNNVEIWSMIKGLELKPVVDALSKLNDVLGQYANTEFAGSNCTVNKILEHKSYVDDTELQNAVITVDNVQTTVDALLKKYVTDNGADAKFNAFTKKNKNELLAKVFDPGLTLGEILDKFDKTNPIAKILGWINFGKMNVTAKMDGKFFGSINANMTGIKVGLSGSDIDSLLDIVLPLIPGLENTMGGKTLQEWLNGLVGGLPIGDLVQNEILSKGLYLTVDSVTVANTYTKGI